MTDDLTARTGLNAEQRSQRGRIGALARWAKHDGTTSGAAGQRGLNARFAREVDPDGTLPEAERERRVEAARKAHFARLSLKSSKVRTARRLAREAGRG